MRYSDIVLDDTELSLAAKGAFAALSLLGNDCSIAELAKRTKDGPAGARDALAELEAAGYVELDEQSVRVRRPGEFGVAR